MNTERVRKDSVWCVWCVRYLAPAHPGSGIDVPGFIGGGHVELCEACERDRLWQLNDLARAGENPQPQPETSCERDGR